MDDSSDRVQLLYKLIKPSLHPASIAKGQSHRQNDSTRSHIHAETHSPAAVEFTIASWRALWMWRGKQGAQEEMTQPWSLVR